MVLVVSSIPVFDINFNIKILRSTLKVDLVKSTENELTYVYTCILNIRTTFAVTVDTNTTLG